MCTLDFSESHLKHEFVSKQMNRIIWWAMFAKFICYEAGDGSKIRFWRDIWCGDYSLKNKFAELFLIARNRHNAGRLFCFIGGIHWNPSFLRAVQDWESESMTLF